MSAAFAVGDRVQVGPAPAVRGDGFVAPTAANDLGTIEDLFEDGAIALVALDTATNLAGNHLGEQWIDVAHLTKVAA